MERALVMLAVEASKAVVMVPAADWTEIPTPRAWLVSLFLTKTNWAGGEALEPSLKDKVVKPAPPAAVATVKLESVAVSAKVKAMSLASVVVMVLPEAAL